MELGIKGKKVLIVGLGKGIGKAIVRAYADEGAYLTVLSRDKRNLKKIIDEIGGKKCRHSYLAVKLMEYGVPKNTAEKLISENICFDIVVHNIGGSLGIRDPLGQVEDWNKVWRLNTGIAIEMNNILIPPMIKQNWGRIIHISSISSRILKGAPQYCCAKAYLNAYVITVGRHFAKKGIVMSAILPGAVEFENSYWAEIKETNKGKYYGFLNEHQAINRMGTPEEIAAFALFMGSEQVRFASASIIPVDGGNM